MACVGLTKVYDIPIRSLNPMSRALEDVYIPATGAAGEQSLKIPVHAGTEGDKA